MHSINGMPIYENALAQTIESGKPFAWKGWMEGRAYYKRQVKKLAKRYGPLIYKPAIFNIQDPVTGRPAIVIHPSLMSKLREALAAA